MRDQQNEHNCGESGQISVIVPPFESFLSMEYTHVVIEKLHIFVKSKFYESCPNIYIYIYFAVYSMFQMILIFVPIFRKNVYLNASTPFEYFKS